MSTQSLTTVRNFSNGAAIRRPARRQRPRTPPRPARRTTIARAGQRRRNFVARRGGMSPAYEAATAYASVLSNPFSNNPVRLGFGTMAPTELVTLYARTIVSASADGTVGVLLFPSVGNYPHTPSDIGGLYFSNTTSGAAPAWTEVAWQNPQPAVALLEEGRIVAAGIRVLPMVPGTSAPGVAYAASLPSLSWTNISGTPKDQLLQSPLFTWGLAANGAASTSRPIDPDSYTFHHRAIVGYDSDTDSAVTVPMIIMNGLPAASSVQLEAVMHVEGIRGWNSANSAFVGTGQPGASHDSQYLPSIYSSVEHLWSVVRRILPAAATVQAASSLGNALLAPVSRTVHTIGSGMNTLTSRTRQLALQP